MTEDQEHLKCSTYSSDKDACSAHFIRTVVLNEIVLDEINKMVAFDKSSGHRTQEIEIHYRFDVAVTTAVADSMKYDKKRKAA